MSDVEKILELQKMTADTYNSMLDAAVKSIDGIEDRTQAWLVMSRAINLMIANHYGAVIKKSEEFLDQKERDLKL